MWNAQAVPAGYGGWWSALWLALVLAAAAGYVAFGIRRHRWPGLGVAAVAGLVIASLGLTAPGRDLLRALGGFWSGFAVLRDGQQFIAPLALAEALGIGLLADWAARPRTSVAAGEDSATVGQEANANPGTAVGQGASVSPGATVARRGTADRAGLVIAMLLVLAPVLLLPGLAWGAAGRLRPVWYPPQWLNAARLIDDSRATGKVLLLPWAAYRRPAWNGSRALLDPWPRLLSRPVIWNDGPRVGHVQMLADDPAARRLNAVIAAPGPLTPALKAAGVRFVIADGDRASGDRGVPGLAGRLPGATVVTVAPGLVVYRLGGPAGR
jgi:hypothetical protein